MSPSDLRRYRAERLLRKDFSALRSKVLAIVRSQLRVKSITLDPSDLEACYALAWHALYATVLAGEQVENPSAWLVLVTFRRAIDESRSAARSRVGGERQPAYEAELDGGGQRAGAFDPDLAGTLDDLARLRHLFEGLRTRLSERECEAASLCYLHGLSRAEAATQMGISETRMRKLMEGAGAARPGVASKVGALLDTIKRGSWCEQQSSLMRAFAFGILDPDGERHALAASHCRECPACRAHVASLRGLASVLPLPLISPLALAGGSGASAGAVATDAGTTARTRVGGARAARARMTARVRSGGARFARARMTASTPVTAAGSRASRFIPTGWSGLSGSLIAKLAVTALLVLGGGYALLGSRAHGSPPVAPAAVAPAPAARSALSRGLVEALGARAHGARPRMHSFAVHPRAPRPRALRLRALHPRSPRPFKASVLEFLPERSNRRVVPAPVAPVSSPAAARLTPEFGIE